MIGKQDFGTVKIPPIVDITKSWLAINPVVGCTLDCKYCLKSQWLVGSQPRLVYSPEASVEALVTHRLFREESTPIAINVNSTDPFLPGSKEHTFKCLQLLDERGVSNIVGLTTKYGLSEDEITKLKAFRHIKIVILVSFASIPSRIEPFSSKKRMNVLKLLSQSGIPTILYFRPIVEGWNDEKENIKRVLLIGLNYVNAIAIGGLRLSQRIKDRLLAASISIPYPSLDFRSKTLSLGILSTIRDCQIEEEVNLPVFIRTKCAISYVSKKFYNTQVYWAGFPNCSKDCSLPEREICFLGVQRE